MRNQRRGGIEKWKGGRGEGRDEERGGGGLKGERGNEGKIR